MHGCFNYIDILYLNTNIYTYKNIKYNSLLPINMNFALNWIRLKERFETLSRHNKIQRHCGR